MHPFLPVGMERYSLFCGFIAKRRSLRLCLTAKTETDSVLFFSHGAIGTAFGDPLQKEDDKLFWMLKMRFKRVGRLPLLWMDHRGLQWSQKQVLFFWL